MSNKNLSDEYKNLLRWEHQNTPGKWGHTANRMVEVILHYVDSVNLTEILDYGSGHGGFGIAVKNKYGNTKYSVYEYEPSDNQKSEMPLPRDFVICIDVLEHVEPEYLSNVLDDLQRVVLKYGYFTISCRRATKILKDGRNAHLIVESPEWWRRHIECRFNIIEESYDSSDKNYKVFVKNINI